MVYRLYIVEKSDETHYPEELSGVNNQNLQCFINVNYGLRDSVFFYGIVPISLDEAPWMRP